MQEFPARSNIERFRRLIAHPKETDSATRDRRERMLADEQPKLRTYNTLLVPTPSQEHVIGDLWGARV